MSATTFPVETVERRVVGSRSGSPDDENVGIEQLRSICPQLSVETELIVADESVAVVKATILGPSIGMVTAHGSCRAVDGFHQVERAETSAIARAVRIALSTLEKTTIRRASTANDRSIRSERNTGRNAKPDRHSAGKERFDVMSLNQTATDRQLKFVAALFGQLGMDEDEIQFEIAELLGDQALAGLDRRQASLLINHLQQFAELERTAS
jgi:hypothetical protein